MSIGGFTVGSMIIGRAIRLPPSSYTPWEPPPDYPPRPIARKTNWDEVPEAYYKTKMWSEVPEG